MFITNMIVCSIYHVKLRILRWHDCAWLSLRVPCQSLAAPRGRCSFARSALFHYMSASKCYTYYKEASTSYDSYDFYLPYIYDDM